VSLLVFGISPNLTGDTRTLSKAERFLFMGKVAEKVDANVANRLLSKVLSSCGEGEGQHYAG